MKLQDIINTPFNLASVFVITLVAYLGVNRYFSIRQLEVKNDIVNTCMQNSGVYEYTDAAKGVRSTAPQSEVYKNCLKDKGYSVPQN